jgi:hypothetical protein
MKIKIKRSETECSVPTTLDLVAGEIAMNITDKKIYTRLVSGAIVEIANADNLTGATRNYGSVASSITDTENWGTVTSN